MATSHPSSSKNAARPSGTLNANLLKPSLIIMLTAILAFSCIPNKKIQTGESDQKKISSPRDILDAIVKLAKENSLYTHDVDWNELDREIANQFKDDGSLSSLKAPLTHMMTRLGDFHGFIMVNNEQYRGTIKRKRNVSYDYESPEYGKTISAIFQKTSKEFNMHPTMLADSIAYFQIPVINNITGVKSETIEYTQKIRNEICKLEKDNPKGYIIDLRGNLGGNFWPMFSGLGELFPNMELGGDTKDGKSFHGKWSLKDGNFRINKYSVPNMPALKCQVRIGNRKVAVLIGRYTASSGEAVASGLKGHKNIRLFGEQSAGASTTNGWQPIAEKVFFNPAVAYYMSVDRTLHKDGITPDVLIMEEYNPDHPTVGETIRRAIQWIHAD
jgi:carboxyl-terminal processing protease